MADPVLIDRAGLQPTAPPTPVGTSGLVPIAFSNQIIQMATEASMALSSFRTMRMPTGVQNLPVLDALPVANWVTGEPAVADASGGKKGITAQQWKGKVLTAEELAAIVVIPEAVLEDASIDLWSEISPRLAESIAAALDAAVFSGVNKPASWPDDIIKAATAAGALETAGAGGIDPTAKNYNELFSKVEDQGYMVNGVFAGVSQRRVFRGWDVAGVPTYLTDWRSDKRTNEVIGTPVEYDQTGAFNAGVTKAVAIAGDPSKAIIGIRTDIQYKVLTEATLDVSQAQDGSEMISLAQQDAVALRVRARFGFTVANPVTHLAKAAGNRYPFAVLKTT